MARLDETHNTKRPLSLERFLFFKEIHLSNILFKPEMRRKQNYVVSLKLLLDLFLLLDRSMAPPRVKLIEILQSLCEQYGLTWDEQLSNDIPKRWRVYTDILLLPASRSFTDPRWTQVIRMIILSRFSISPKCLFVRS